MAPCMSAQHGITTEGKYVACLQHTAGQDCAITLLTMTRNAALLTRKGLTLVPIVLFVPTGMLDRLVPLNCGIYPIAGSLLPDATPHGFAQYRRQDQTGATGPLTGGGEMPCYYIQTAAMLSLSICVTHVCGCTSTAVAQEITQCLTMHNHHNAVQDPGSAKLTVNANLCMLPALFFLFLFHINLPS